MYLGLFVTPLAMGAGTVPDLQRRGCFGGVQRHQNTGTVLEYQWNGKVWGTYIYLVTVTSITFSFFVSLTLMLTFMFHHYVSDSETTPSMSINPAFFFSLYFVL